MMITMLGTGTSHGIPVIGCECKTCNSNDPRDFRTRSSVYLLVEEVAILIDTATELRLQSINNRITKVDAVLLTHSHADHISGFDDLRRFNELQDRETPVYGSPETLQGVQGMFPYIFNPNIQTGGGKPKVKLEVIRPEMEVCGIRINPIPIWHGTLSIFGYRIGDFAYLTDCSSIPDSSMGMLTGLELLILGVLRYRPHPTHLHLEGGLEIIRRLKPKRTLLTHICHDFQHEEVNSLLPPGVELGYDGQGIKL